MKKSLFVVFLTVSAFWGYCIFDSTSVSAQEPEKEETSVYEEWEYQDETNCLVSPEGVLFSKEYVKYEAGTKTGMCKKYTRRKVD